LGYCVGKEDLRNHNLIVVDLGGGTFDVTVLNYDRGFADVLATKGDTHLGGQDFDNRIVEHCIKEFKKSDKIDISGDPKALLRLKAEVEKMKKVLSVADEVEIHIDQLKDEDFDCRLTRKKFNELCAPEYDKIIPLIKLAIKDAKLKKEDMHTIVLAGGSIRVPVVKDLLS